MDDIQTVNFGVLFSINRNVWNNKNIILLLIEYEIRVVDFE